jgi:hypothetical protein
MHIHKLIFILCILALFACSAHGDETVDPRSIFKEPVNLKDGNGNEVKTKLGGAHPVVYDWNGDGKNDIILGSKVAMMTVSSQVQFIENIGTKGEPKLKWPTETKLKLGDVPLKMGCGCNTGGTFEVQPLDWNGDGHFDLILNTRSRASVGAFLALNRGKSRTELVFDKKQKLYVFRGHGHGSGGGDWNSDGIPDYAHHVNGNGWEVFLGVKDADKKHRVPRYPNLRSVDYTLKDPNKFVQKGERTRWFETMVYAWNFSGRHKPKDKPIRIKTFGCPHCHSMGGVDILSPTTELVASNGAGKGKSRIDLYQIDHVKKSVTFKCTLDTIPVSYARLSVGDLNHDGCMDVVYTANPKR